MTVGREDIEKNKWLVKGEIPLISRLAFGEVDLKSSPLIGPHNISVRNELLDGLLSKEIAAKRHFDILDNNGSNDVLISEVDRYGIPLRTLINRNTGLVRSDPYYSPEWLDLFYSRFYRELYSNKESLSRSSIFADQIQRGDSYFNFISDHIAKDDRVLEIGCGMGGVLFPFKLNGLIVKGVDLGREFVELGNNFSLNLSLESIDDLIDKSDKYDLIILSHLIEHVPDLLTFLNKVKQLLNRNGKIFIAVPGIKKIHETYHENVHIYLQNAHCWSFSKNTLSATLNKAGFRILKIDDYINCLAIVSNQLGDLPFDLGKEAAEIIQYLLETEKRYQDKSSKSTARKGYFRLLLKSLKGTNFG